MTRLSVIILGLSYLSVSSKTLADEDTPRPAPKWLKLVDLSSDDARLKGYRVPEGVKVEIVADSPTAPAGGMTFAEDGTPFVIEYRPGKTDWNAVQEFTYKDGSRRKVIVPRTSGKKVIKALEDTKGKGVWDRAKVVLEEDDPSAILVHDGWLYTAARGIVHRYRQSKAGMPFDVKEVVAQGFSGVWFKQVSGMTLGNDGLLYISSGDGDNVVEGSDGSRATVLRSAAIFRCRPDGSKIEVLALGLCDLRSGVGFDAASQMFLLEGDFSVGQGSRFVGSRLLHIAEGSDFGWRRAHEVRAGYPDPTRAGQEDPARAATFGERPSKMRPLLSTGRSTHGGLLIYNETFFPGHYRGLLFCPDYHNRLIRAYRVERDGAGFRVVEQFDLMSSKDPDFRPHQLIVGPDGAIYVADLRSSDGKGGRILRLTWGGTKEHPAIAPRARDSWAKICKQSDEDLLKTFRSENFSDRQVAQRELVKRGDKNRAALVAMLEDTDVPGPARMAALGALHAFWNDDVAKAVRGRLIDTDSDVRRLAIEALGMNGEAKGVEVVGLLEDGDLDVRRAAALALGRTAAPGSADTLVNALLANESRDVLLHDGLIRAIEATGKTGIEQLVAQFESGDKKKINLVADTFLRLRIRLAADAIPRLLTYPHLTIKQRADLVRSYNNYLLDPPVSLEPMLDYLLKHPEDSLEVKRAGLDVLAADHRPAGSKAEKWVLGMLENEDTRIRLAVLALIEQKRLSKAAPALVKLRDDDKRPKEEREAAIRALKAIGDGGK